MTKEENQIVLKVFRLMLENRELFGYGICAWNGILLMKELINGDEHYSTIIYIIDKLPPKTNGVYCWTPGDITPRIEWINEQIVTLENELK
jgi:hypothetical protein